MSEGRKERADAARNRRAILEATEKLLAAHSARDISMEQVAAEAGVGKGTIFHRFGSRAGLMRALMYERARALSEAIADGPPPLGPGAPDRDRLLAFLDAIIETVARNKSLLSELAHTDAAEISAQDRPADEDKPVYSIWHAHLSGLLAAQRADVDAGTTADLILGALHSEPLLARLNAEGPERVAAALRDLALSVLDAPPPVLRKVLLLPPPAPAEHLPVRPVPIAPGPGLVDGVRIEDRRAGRRLQEGGLGQVQVAPDVGDGDHRDLVRLDETQLVVLERLEEASGGLVVAAQLALDLPVDPGATAHPHHDALEDVLFLHREDVLQDAELLAVPGQHGHPKRDAFVRNLEFAVVLHSASRYSECAARSSSAGIPACSTSTASRAWPRRSELSLRRHV